jgi:hypothetical protein
MTATLGSSRQEKGALQVFVRVDNLQCVQKHADASINDPIIHVVDRWLQSCVKLSVFFGFDVVLKGQGKEEALHTTLVFIRLGKQLVNRQHWSDLRRSKHCDAVLEESC